MEKNVAHGGWTTSLLTVAAQHGGCGRHNGMEEEKNRVGAGHNYIFQNFIKGIFVFYY